MSFGVEGEGTLGRVFGVGLRGTAPALAGKLGEGWSFRAVREGGVDRFQCSLRPDPAAAVFFGSAGPGLRNCRGRSHLFTQKGTLSTLLLSWQGLRGTRPALAGKLWKGWSFRAVREGGFDRFQCLLRPDPAAAVFFWLRGRWAKSQGRGRSKGVLVDCVWSSEGGGVRVVCGWWGSLGSAPRGPSCRIYPGTFSKELGH